MTALLTSRRVWIPAEFWADCGDISICIQLSANSGAYHLGGLWNCCLVDCGHRCDVVGRLRQVGCGNSDAKKRQGGPSFNSQKSRVGSFLTSLSPTTSAPFSIIDHIMSRASQITLAATSLGTIGICLFVHYAQRSEKAVGHPYPIHFGRACD